MNAPALLSLVAQRAALPFEWGTRDCALWVFDAVRAFTGRDPAADLRGIYRTPRAALRLVEREHGWAHICATRIGEPILPENAQTGDVAQVDTDHCSGETADCGALAVVVNGQLVAQGEDGLVSLPLSAALACWRPRG